jgi:hypothetical protein
LTQVSEYGYPGGPMKTATWWLGSTVDDTVTIYSEKPVVIS